MDRSVEARSTSFLLQLSSSIKFVVQRVVFCLREGELLLYTGREELETTDRFARRKERRREGTERKKKKEEGRSGTHFAMNNDVAELSLVWRDNARAGCLRGSKHRYIS